MKKKSITSYKFHLIAVFAVMVLLVLGMIVGAAIAHNFGLAGTASKLAEAGTYTPGGVATAGKIAVGIGFAVLLLISVLNILKKKNKEANA